MMTQVLPIYTLLRRTQQSMSNYAAYPRHEIEEAGTGPYTRRLIGHLEQIARLTGFRPQTVFAHWIAWTEAAVSLVPEHLRAMVQNDFAPDTSSQALSWLYEVARTHTPRSAGYIEETDRLWSLYLDALEALIDSTRPGLWAYNDANKGYLNVDILGDVYLAYSRQDLEWTVHDLASWEALVGDAQRRIEELNIDRDDDEDPGGPAKKAKNKKKRRKKGNHSPVIPAIRPKMNGYQQVMELLKRALLHPQNKRGQQLMRQTLPDSSQETMFRWLRDEAIPAAYPFYQPIVLKDTWCGTGTRILAMASLYPDWAVWYGLVRFWARDPDVLTSLSASINFQIWGLNGYFGYLYRAMTSTGWNREIVEPADMFMVAINSFRTLNLRRHKPFPGAALQGWMNLQALFPDRVINPQQSYLGKYMV